MSETTTKAVVYHVTREDALEAIMESGLQPNHDGDRQFPEMADYCAGKVFFTDRAGVRFWAKQMSRYDHVTGRPDLDIVVLAFDEPETHRADEDTTVRTYSRYTREEIPADALRVVPRDEWKGW